MIIVIITINSKEIIDFINEFNGIEVRIGNKSCYIIENKDDIYFIWNDFTDDTVENDKYLYNFRVFCEKDKNYDMFLFYKPENMIRYDSIYRNQPIYKLENISILHYQKIKNKVIDIFKDVSFVDNGEKLKKIEKSLKYDLLQKMSGEIYEFYFTDKSFRNKFKNNICVIS